MLLIDMEYKSYLTVMASKDGIETVEDYNVWLIGYMSGFRTGVEKMTETLNKDIREVIQDE